MVEEGKEKARGMRREREEVREKGSERERMVREKRRLRGLGKMGGWEGNQKSDNIVIFYLHVLFKYLSICTSFCLLYY